ncbi:hypothetical protein LA080_007201 [Diaporthe eres]|nr:hypothetical protein LA080_007201 [Diaporthe eres]
MHQEERLRLPAAAEAKEAASARPGFKSTSEKTTSGGGGRPRTPEAEKVFRKTDEALMTAQYDLVIKRQKWLHNVCLRAEVEQAVNAVALAQKAHTKAQMDLDMCHTRAS